MSTTLSSSVPTYICSHFFLSLLNPISSSHCLLVPEHASLTVHTSIPYLEDSNSINILVKCNVFLEAFPHSPARSPPLCFHTKVSIIAPSKWPENYLFILVFPPVRGHLQERSDQGSCVFISQSWV